MKFAALLGILGIAALAMSACGGDENGPTTTGTPASPTAVASVTAEEQAATQALLQAAALQAADVPEGFVFEEGGFTTNEDEGQSLARFPGDITVDDLNRLGRILGYAVTYSRPAASGSEGALLLEVTVELYRDADGAREAFEMGSRVASDPRFVETFREELEGGGTTVGDVNLSPADVPEVGEERDGYDIELSVHYAESSADVNLVGRHVGILRDRGIASVALWAFDSPPPAAQVEALARTLDERMKDALE